ncbi:hypothetical protein OAE11_00225 [Akkermansiaceae bacterium]|nr:hypothetical protein [Akkermansiaceae bacterium]MDB4725077.1 hypothetical protein [Akkermansiaceae bacterium]
MQQFFQEGEGFFSSKKRSRLWRTTADVLLINKLIYNKGFDHTDQLGAPPQHGGGGGGALLEHEETAEAPMRRAMELRRKPILNITTIRRGGAGFYSKERAGNLRSRD